MWQCYAGGKRIVIATAAIVLALVSVPPVLSAPKAGGLLRMSLTGDPTSVDPIVPFDNPSIWTMLLMYDQLVRAGKDGASVDPGVADSWKTGADGKTWVLHIREGVKFSDGSPLTAADVQFSLERAASKDANYASNFGLIDTVKATDPHTVVVILKKPSASFLAYASLYSASVVPEKLVDSEGKAFWDHPVGSGPYILVERVKNDHITLRRNSYYWQRPYPYLDELRFDVLTDDNTRMLKFRSGELDVATNVPPNQVDVLKRVNGVTVKLFPQMAINFVLVNHARKPLSDARVRAALNYAVDRPAILKTVLFGYGRVATSMLPPMLDWNDQLRPYSVNLSKAKALLRDAGYGNGVSIELLVASGDSTAGQIATILKDEFSAIGVDLKVTVIDRGTILSRRKAGEFDLVVWGYSSDVIDPDELVAFGLDYAGGGLARYMSFKNSRLSELAAAAEAEINPQKRRAAYFEIQKIAYDQFEAIPLFYPYNRTVLSDRVHDFMQLPTSNYRLWETWLSK